MNSKRGGPVQNGGSAKETRWQKPEDFTRNCVAEWQQTVLRLRPAWTYLCEHDHRIIRMHQMLGSAVSIAGIGMEVKEPIVCTVHSIYLHAMSPSPIESMSLATYKVCGSIYLHMQEAYLSVHTAQQLLGCVIGLRKECGYWGCHFKKKGQAAIVTVCISKSKSYRKAFL